MTIGVESLHVFQLPSVSDCDCPDTAATHVHTASLSQCMKLTRILVYYTVVKKNRTPFKSSNSCTEYETLSLMFGLKSRQRVFSHQVSNW